MTYRWKQTFAAVGILALTTAVVHAGIKVKVEFDKEYDFSKVRTYGWHPDGAGEVKLLMREGGDPEQIRVRWEPTIKDAVEKETGQARARAGDKRRAGPLPQLLLSLGPQLRVSSTAASSSARSRRGASPTSR